ncbi:HAUS augmin-like complex subunit 6 isoform X1 [Pangasianodon hypophthalmus]|uniref:HAUS augmin-like complex subunit 6 isoform X1 n=1 Tax=Pangasianodon hypophthalmus TaxID=310915 RepID=UPI000EFEA29B|nr:HAUS augmin-like complex subunit 6 isoform X1 [Pangasianodon hypophthalmus]XP_053089156.1 HAUS augmin-like complex subunit 6 isoform X1 [Pangasianodon hypophthalmus]
MMCNVQDAGGRYLWWYLQSMEFHLDVAASTKGKTNIKHLNLGMNMFDKPNKEASYLVVHFLFKKLNPTRVQDVFRHCWPVLDHKSDAEFRKVTFGWLQEIANEKGSNFPKVVASHLHSSSGPRFVNLMLHLAKYVMLKMMKNFSTDGTWVPEAAAVPASSQELELKRFQMVKRRFQRVSVEQDALIQDYQKRARHLEKSLKDHKAEDVKYDDLLKKYENTTNLEKDLLEKIHKVRSLWAEIDKALSRLEGERSMLASVIEGKGDQYVLDGKDISVKIPAVLLERMERLSHQTSAGSLYEEGQPVILRLLELLNVGLRLLSEERAKLSGPSSQLSHQPLQEQALLMNRSKETLKSMRRKLTKEDIPQIKSNIKKLELDWEKKWAECLSHTPLTSFLKDDPVLDFLSPMPPLSFEAASEVSFKASIFSQYPAKLSELPEQTLKEQPCLTEQEVKMDGDFLSSSLPVEDKTEDILFSSCFASPRPVSPCVVHPLTPTSVKVPSVAPTPSPVQASKRRPLLSQMKTSAVKPKAQILELEYENLASQFAEAVTMSPVDGRKSGMELEQLLNTLADPFTTKKQLPRTPESLIMDVRTSWRKAVEEGKAEKKQEKCHDSLSWVRTPISEGKERSPSPENFSLRDSAILNADPLPCSPLPSQQGTSLHSTVAWDTSHLEALSQSSSNIIHFSIAHETFPDAENDVSFNCSDGSEEVQEVEELLLPPVTSCSPEVETTHQMVRRHLDESPFAARFKETKSDFMPAALRTSPGLGSCSGEKVFSLDLDQLESFSSPLREELTLPNLVTFSPMDEL